MFIQKDIIMGDVISIKSKDRWHDLTYKLIYPAFFGNMVYDLISMIKNQDHIYKDEELILAIASIALILVFYLIDYVHLNIDLEKTISEDKKGAVYIFCDIAISLLLFLAVVFVKFSLPAISIVCLSLVPVLFAWYNIKLDLHVTFHKWFRLFSLIVLSCFTFAYLVFDICHLVIMFLLLVTSFSFSATYLYYNCRYYWFLPNS